MSERIVPARYSFQVPIKIWFEPEYKTGKLQMPAENLFVWGETHDLSRSGIAFVVPSIRIKENYLVGAGTRPLNAELDLPNGRAQIRLSGRRYEQISDEHNSISRYLIGASIELITPENLETYEYFLKHGNRAEASRSSFELGIDKG